MYLKYFQFSREPFNITPDPEFFFLSSAHKEALASIIYGVEQKKGFVLVVGEIGVGKTTVVRSYLSHIDPSKLTSVYVLNPMLSFSNLLKQICREVGLASNTRSSFEMLDELHRYLVDEFKGGRNIVIIIDEAQNMPVDTLENLRMLSNIETSREKLIQIVFIAQPEFEKTLSLPELKQLKQRISVKAVISPLDPASGVAYIRSRLAKAAALESVPFTAAALKDIVRLAQGIPRVINILCDNCLINAYGCGQKVVNSAMVRSVAREFGIKGYQLYKCSIAAAVAVLFAVCGLSFYPFPHMTKSSRFLAVPETKVVLAEKLVSSPERQAYVVRVVQRGDTLAKLVTQAYGRADKGTMLLVRKANPTITDENVIVEGARLRFPILSEP
ncbi:AAA family ATPase [Geomonas anaerohicana]|uniref:AAA family ATPase n=1 Tax=Geomonas anaerohicana TaxID=2798583 RepID=A0ABS0YH55_9BACT|nr:AAA family ATPase [Geomonas anaerohicana]MBJ6751625.1 AAA family ATPase [Geomonas anaerohicana]